jgi:hypothetical protein
MRQLFWATAVIAAACAGTTAPPDTGTAAGAAGGGAAAVPTDDAMAPPDSRAPPIPIDQAADRIGAAMCDGLAACCASKGFAFSRTMCEAAVHGGATDGLCPSGTTYDPQAAGDCVAMERIAYAACTQPASEAAALCERVCVGSTPIGEGCHTTRECQGGQAGTAECSRTEGMDGVCAPLVRGQAGDACSRKGAGQPSGVTRCYASDDLYCASDGTCQRLLPAGATCASDSACQAGTYCAMDGTCTARKSAGTPCTSAGECAGVCDYGTMKCADARAAVSLDVSAAACANPRL